MNLEDSVSPLDYRYYGINQRLYALAHPHLYPWTGNGASECSLRLSGSAADGN